MEGESGLMLGSVRGVTSPVIAQPEASWAERHSKSLPVRSAFAVRWRLVEGHQVLAQGIDGGLRPVGELEL
jgi:hypothetical protein